MTRALLDSGAGFNLVSEKVSRKLKLEVDRHPAGLATADGQRARSIGIVREASVSSNHLHLTMHFSVRESVLFDFIIGILAAEALQGCQAFGLQQVTSVPGSKKATILFQYAAANVPVGDNLEIDNEDFTCDSDAAPDVDAKYEENFLVLWLKNYTRVMVAALLPVFLRVVKKH